MGCDIHGLFEAKEKKTGKWLPFRAVSEGRSYEWFGVVAGVRRQGIAVVDTDRGIPDDTCDLWQSYCEDWGIDLHSHTWLTPSEVNSANQALRDHVRRVFSEELANDYEEVPTPDEQMTEIIMGFGYPDNKTIPWAGTIRDFIGENADIEECVRYVIAFDN